MLALTTTLALLLTGPAAAAAAPEVDFDVDLSEYLDPQARPGQAPEVLLALALSGGGMRAANFALGVMLAMEQQPTLAGNLLAEVDYLSTASGGGLAAAAYLGARHDHLHDDVRARGVFRFADRLQPGTPLAEAVRTGYGHMLTAAGCRTATVGRDRGHGFEKLLNDELLGAASPRAKAAGRSLVLGDLFHPAALPIAPELLLPLWVANAASAESGALVPMTPGTLARSFVTGYVHRCADVVLHDPFALPWSVALKASASLPGVIPETALRTGFGERTNVLQLIDGGVSDNQGIITALELLRQAAVAHPERRRRILIVVDAYRGDAEADFSDSESGRVAAVAAGRAIYLLKAAQRLNYAKLARQVASAYGIEIVYLGFSAIADPALRDAASRVATDLSVSPKEQELLWQAGAQAFASQAARLSDELLAP
jgi:predicted acylesterase/phospholipase RssA